MENVLNLISSFPTVIYTVPLVMCLVFWLFGMLGLFDVDFLDIDVDIDADVDAGPAGALAALGLTGVPLIFSVSLLFLFSWAISLFSSAWLLPLVTHHIIWMIAAVVVVIFSFMIAIFFTGKITKPMSKIFVTHEARSNQSLVSKTCQITTLKVDQDFGQAKVEDGGAGFIISVRAEQPNDLTKGNHALIYEYDPQKNLYHIVKQD